MDRKRHPYSNLRYQMPGSVDQLSFGPIFRPDGEFSHFNVLRGTEVVGWDWDLVGAIETAHQLAYGLIQKVTTPQPWTPEGEPQQCV
jgi:hypothetical protein